MSRKPLIVSFLLIGIGLSLVKLLPHTFDLQPAAVVKAFPTDVGEWEGRHIEPGENEKKVLDEQTEFVKRTYFRESPSHTLEWEMLDATMVLSGEDMNNSIHRPERCLKAQGFANITPSEVSIDVGEGNILKVTRLHFIQKLKTGGEIPAIMYYWFVGADQITNSHYGRTFRDMVYRLATGSNQSWAYISLQASYGDIRRENQAANTEAEADAFMVDFVQRTFFPIHKTEKIKGWEDAKPPKPLEVAVVR